MGVAQFPRFPLRGLSPSTKTILANGSRSLSGRDGFLSFGWVLRFSRVLRFTQLKRKERYINHKSSMSHIIYFQIRIFKPILWYAVYYNCNTNNKTYCYYCCCYCCCYSCYFCWCYCCARRRRNHGVVSRVQATARAKAQVWATAKP